ncbi:Inositol polyphosphate kinase [Carpediemonas membranifera]|uniref:Kinase n=1 Tax=Carpediemonas membranifera TaxID=201153 RepID=A0A8J6BW30_9EUKA|nr:Inositol polyphosphate kinase [Carpediemonas membranifera]|eukprot:KAG9392016.1 Inositol polyphosphate kinase [Carpediemonas membranifera]
MPPSEISVSSKNHDDIAIAGHKLVARDDSRLFILKMLAIDSERTFFEKILPDSSLVEYCPEYYGVYHKKADGKFISGEPPAGSTAKPFICMSNLFRGMERPNAIELKMGVIQHRQTASESKMAKSVKKCKATTSWELGFRVNGTLKTLADGYVEKKSKFVGRDLKKEDLPSFFKTFFADASEEQLATIRDQVNGLLDVMSGPRGAGHRFISTSLLLCFDSGAGGVSRIGMIDFPHIEVINGIDEGYVKGLRSLAELLDHVRD